MVLKLLLPDGSGGAPRCAREITLDRVFGSRVTAVLSAL